MWQIRAADAAEVAAIARALDVTDPVARVLWLRGLRTPEAARAYWEGRDDLGCVARPVEAPGMQAAVERLQRAIAGRETIAVYGDYDCDGVTSAALLATYLRGHRGAEVRAYVPDRVADGYGLTPAAVRRVHAEGARVIVTCDNGIGAVAAVETARELGVDVIVTDHHEPPARLPEAHAIVHPRCGFEDFTNLAGVGVALLLAVALEGGWHDGLAPLLDLVAVGTVADVVPLVGPNRALVWAGLERLRTTPRPGLAALVSAAGPTRGVTSRDLAFRLAPMINAAGRLDRAELALELLLAPDDETARGLAAELRALNQARRDVDRTLVGQLLDDIEREAPHTALPFLVLADRDFHPGVVGNVAGRLSERLAKPVLLLAEHAPGVWRGSARAPEGYSLHTAFRDCGHLLASHGGHARAAGCTVAEAEIPALRQALCEHLEAAGWQAPTDDVSLEACPPLAAYTPRLMAELERFEPTGFGNPPPAFGLLGARAVGARTDRSGRHLFVQVDDGETTRELAAWDRGGELEALADGAWIDLAIQPTWSRYRGGTRLELRIERHSLAERPPEEQAGPGPAIHDLRHSPDRLVALRRALTSGPAGLVGVYTGDRLPDLGLDRALGQREARYGSDRHPAGPVDVLVMWERPPDLAAWARLRADARAAVYLLWEPHQVDPTMSVDWLHAFHRELGALADRPWSAVQAHVWPTTGLMRDTAFALLAELGVLAVDGDDWRLDALPAACALEPLAAFHAYGEAHAFRRCLANGSRTEVLAALRGARQAVGGASPLRVR